VPSVTSGTRQQRGSRTPIVPSSWFFRPSRRTVRMAGRDRCPSRNNHDLCAHGVPGRQPANKRWATPPGPAALRDRRARSGRFTASASDTAWSISAASDASAGAVNSRCSDLAAVKPRLRPAFVPSSRKNADVGTIAVVPTSEQRRIRRACSSTHVAYPEVRPPPGGEYRPLDLGTDRQRERRPHHDSADLSPHSIWYSIVGPGRHLLAMA
jgi:hypothetical protein